MTDTADAPRREDARALQAKLYREIGIAAVSAALLSTTPPPSAAADAAGTAEAADARTKAARPRAA